MTRTVKIMLCFNGVMPKKAHPDDACYDAYSSVDETIPAKSIKVIQLGIRMQLPPSFECQVRPRSGLSRKGIEVILGTVDEGYTGIVAAIVHNTTDSDFQVSAGDRICQLAFRQIETVNLCEDIVTSDESSRGDSGFGSTGI